MKLARIIFYKGVRIASFIVGAFGFAFNAVGGNWHSISSNNWGKTGVIAFGVFAILTLVKEIDLMWQHKPNIVVIPEIHDSRATLMVKNTGGVAGDFTAKARVTACRPEAALYSMCWESLSDASCHTDGDGGTASILVAEKSRARQKTDDIDTTFFEGDLVLFRIGQSGVERFPTFSQKSWKTIKGEKEIMTYTLTERCILDVTITPTPTIKNKWEGQKYLCEIEKGRLALSKTRLSSPHVSGQPDDFPDIPDMVV